MEQERRDTDTGRTHGNTGSRGETAYVRYLTVVAVAVTLGSMLFATLLSPAFAWQENALSNLGVTWTDAGTTATAVVFNGGLITGGLVGVIAVVSLYRRLTRRADRVVLGLTGTALALMGLVGVFPQGEMLHFPVAIGFFLLASVTMWADSGRRYHAGERPRAVLVATGGLTNILGWVVWFAVAETPSEGLAVPEILGAVVFAIWLLATAVDLSDG
jgi:hypothetical membrane protein